MHVGNGIANAYILNMSSQITWSEVELKVQDGHHIVWTGSYTDNILGIRLYKDGYMSMHTLDIDKIKPPKDPDVIQHNEATTKPLSFVSITWQRQGWLRCLRVASIYGINTGSRCAPGMGTLPTGIPKLCTMGYDIEVSSKLTRKGEFPPVHSRITSIALHCSCGYCEAWTTIKHKLTIPGLTYCESSSDLVVQSLSAIKEHMPLWLVGYNCYAFDNRVMSYHTPRRLRSTIFKSISTGSKSVSKVALIIDLPGVHNVDLYTYLDKCMRYIYKSLSLGDVAAFHQIKGKTEMPTGEDEASLVALVMYNINDSEITGKLWHLTGVCEQVLGLCVASCSPVIDCVRYITGTMASCFVSSYCISRGMLMDWSLCDLRIGYEGGFVLDPIRKLFTNVSVCDFSSMYPTIMVDMGISPENIEILGSCSRIHEDKILWWTDRSVLLCIKGKIIKFDLTADCMVRNVLKFTLKLRKEYKVSNPGYALAIKVLSNSLFGAFGFAASPLHSPRCAASITVAGRTALALAELVFTGLGLTVIYGDTDSNFLTSGVYTRIYFDGNTRQHVEAALKVFHNTIKYTPFPNMKMEIEEEFKSIILVDKKHYAYADSQSRIRSKGLSATRKDRLGVCRDMSTLLAERILLKGTTEEGLDLVRQEMADAFNIILSAARAGVLDMRSISKEVRYEGNSCYRYTSITGDEVNIPVARSGKRVFIDYDSDKVIKSLEDDLDRICIPAGLGTVKQLIGMSNVLI